MGIDPCLPFVLRARALGFPALPLRVEEMPFREEFDGIWASASLLHSEDLPLALGKCRRALRKGGVLYCSFKKGSFRGMREGRFFQDMEIPSLEEEGRKAGFLPLTLWESEDSQRAGLLWTNGLFRR